jgi:hypothetical protein
VLDAASRLGQPPQAVEMQQQMSRQQVEPLFV